MEKKTTEKQKVSVKKQQWKPGNMLYPLPAVLVSLGREGEKPNLITVAWTGTVCTNPPMVYISVRPERYSYSILKATKTFVINLTTEKLLKATDYCGVRSGRDVDKFERFSLTKEKSEKVRAPRIQECPVNLECIVKHKLSLATHEMFVAEIVNVAASDHYMSGAKLHIPEGELVSYIQNRYAETGRALGVYGYTAKK